MSQLTNGLETVDYGTQGWSAIFNSNFEKLDDAVGGPLTADNDLGDLQVSDNSASQADPNSATAEALTDSTGGTASQTVSAISGSGADTDINNNFASLVDEINKLRADNEDLRTKLAGTIDYCDALKTTVNSLLAKLRKTGGCGVLAN